MRIEIIPERRIGNHIERKPYIKISLFGKYRLIPWEEGDKLALISLVSFMLILLIIAVLV